MKYKDIKDLTVEELKKKKKSLTEEIFMARMKNTLGQLGNPIQIRHMRRDLARLNTAITLKVVR